MVAIFVLLTVLFFVSIEVIRTKMAEQKTKPELFYHEFLPTPTMADGGELIDKKSEEKK